MKTEYEEVIYSLVNKLYSTRFIIDAEDERHEERERKEFEAGQIAAWCK